mmetsp:Transcript_72347/g.189605  ORF Transcript_72347/g.189605 Transcript_72347/m.189605 type:complete len:202 (-) Transcript_72347:418-1023(-)
MQMQRHATVKQGKLSLRGEPPSVHGKPAGEGVGEEDGHGNGHGASHGIPLDPADSPSEALLTAEATDRGAEALLRSEHLALHHVQRIRQRGAHRAGSDGLLGGAEGHRRPVARVHGLEDAVHQVLDDEGRHILGNRPGQRDAHPEEPGGGTARPPQMVQHGHVGHARGRREADLRIPLQHDGGPYERLAGDLHVGRHEERG